MIKVLDTIKFRTTESSPLPGAQPDNFGLLFSSASSLGAYTTLYFTNNTGQSFDLTNANSGSINVLYYTGSAIGDGTTKTYTWTKPTNLRLLKVICLGAGGGGGSGCALYSNFHTATGGMGGGGGGITYTQFFAEELPNNVSITVGAGGAGSLLPVTSSNDNFNQIVNATWAQSGSKGGNTSFGSYVIAEGGYGGYGGSILSIYSGSQFKSEVAVPGGGKNSIPSRGPYSFFGIPGGGYASGFTLTTGSGAHAGIANNPFVSSPYSSLSSPQTFQIYSSENEINLQYTGAIPIAGAGGGAGGGRSTDFSSFGGEFGIGNGGSGSGVFTFNGTLTSGSAGGRRASASTDPAIFNVFTASNGFNGNDNVGKDIITQLIQSFPLKGFTASYGLGTGGGGGGGTYFSGSTHRTNKVAGNGGHGGLYGAGGGGGGGCGTFAVSPTLVPAQGAGGGYPWSGTGGSGSSGLCILVEYF